MSDEYHVQIQILHIIVGVFNCWLYFGKISLCPRYWIKWIKRFNYFLETMKLNFKQLKLQEPKITHWSLLKKS
jgi:hypothetical protein